MMPGKVAKTEMKLDPSLSPYTKLNSKWIKNLSIQQDSQKVLEGKTEHVLYTHFNKTPISQEIQPATDK